MKRIKAAAVTKSSKCEALSEADLLRMLLNAARVNEAKAVLELHTKNLLHQAALGELSATRLEAQNNRNLQTAKGQEQAAKEAFNVATGAARILAEEMGKRYAVDWRHASFDPDTGAIIRLPGDT